MVILKILDKSSISNHLECQSNFLAVNLPFLFGYHGNSYNLGEKWAHIGRHHFRILNQSGTATSDSENINAKNIIC